MKYFYNEVFFLVRVVNLCVFYFKRVINYFDVVIENFEEVYGLKWEDVI